MSRSKKAQNMIYTILLPQCFPRESMKITCIIIEMFFLFARTLIGCTRPITGQRFSCLCRLMVSEKLWLMDGSMENRNIVNYTILPATAFKISLIWENVWTISTNEPQLCRCPNLSEKVFKFFTYASWTSVCICYSFLWIFFSSLLWMKKW